MAGVKSLKSDGFRRWFAAGLVGLMLVLAGPLVAHADSDDDSITRYEVHADVRGDGSVEVTLDFDFDFGRDEGHGPYLTLPERMAIADDPDHWRSLPISDITATSDTAPADLEIDRDGGAVLIQIGDESVDLEGTHRYRVTYRMAGAVNPATGSGLDEFSWNAVGTEWEIPLHDVQVTVEAPAEIEETACFSGKNYDQPCTAEGAGTEAVFSVATLEPGQGMQVVAGVPVGTFDATPILIERHHPSRVLGVNPTSLGIAGVTLVGGTAATAVALRRRGNRQYADVEAGVIPDGEGQARQTRATGEIPVRTEPPQYVSPGLVGVLDDLVADQSDVVAAMIDLAVRGHLRFEEAPADQDAPADDLDAEAAEARWAVRTDPPTGAMLRTHEKVLLNALFADGDRVDLSEPGALTATVTATQKAMYVEATDELGWFNANPSRVRTVWASVGLLLAGIGVVLIFVLGFLVQLGFVGIAITVVGIVIAVGSFWAPGRTALGTAIWTQAQGFKHYLDQVTADQVRVEPGVDLWSQYLPWAMLWGSTAQWTGVFATLSSRGVTVANPIWYVGITSWSWHRDADTIVGSVDALNTAATTAMTDPTVSSGGASGMAGGGGVGGGGGGGW